MDEGLQVVWSESAGELNLCLEDALAHEGGDLRRHDSGEVLPDHVASRCVEHSAQRGGDVKLELFVCVHDRFFGDVGGPSRNIRSVVRSESE